MQITTTTGFWESADDLSKEERRRTRESLSKLLAEPSVGGLRRHSIQNNFISLSVSMDVRIIARQVDDRLVLLHVDHHDAAYGWAERHQLLAAPNSAVLEVITVPETTDSVGKGSKENEYGSRLVDALLASQVPEHMVSGLATCRNDDDVLTRIQSMSKPWQEAIFRVACGEHLLPSDLPTPAASIRVISEDAELESALDRPLTTWRLFLHPRQQEAVNTVEDRVVTITGGPGTGKSVVCAHRAAFLSDTIDESDVVVVFTLAVGLVTQMRSLIDPLLPSQPPFRRKVWELPCDDASDQKRTNVSISIVEGHVFLDLNRMRKKVGAIIVDEFQDCPLWFIDFLNRVITSTDCRFVTVALDMHQMLFRLNHTEPIKKLVGASREIWLPYSYRMTQSLLEHAMGTLNRYAYEYRAYMDLGRGIVHPIATLAGPKVRYVAVDGIPEMVREARMAMASLEARFSETDSLAVIHLQYWSPHFHRRDRTDPLAKALKNDELLGKYYKFGFWTKGTEYFGGVVVCPSDFMARDNLGRDNLLRLNTLYVALTRFRSELTIIYQVGSPAARYLDIG